MSEHKRMSTREFVSVIIAGAMVLTAVVYWIVQVEGVMEMIKLSNGS